LSCPRRPAPARRPPARPFLLPFLAAIGAALLPPPAVLAAETGPFSFTGQVSLGTAVRTDGRDADLLVPGNAAAVGAAGRAGAGRNQDDGNLNYAKGDRIATVLKGLFDAELKLAGGGARLRLKAWHDATLEHGDVPWGNLPNGFAADRPLSDAGFARRARFSGVVAEDAYIYGDFAPGGLPLLARLGWQTLDWGSRSTIPGGLAAVTPVDFAAARRPGALAEETQIAIPALFARLKLDALSGVEGFYQFGFRPNELQGCGTFFSAADYAAAGCDKIMLAANSAASDRALLAAGSYVGRAADREPRDGGQFGVAFTRSVPELGTQFAAHASRYHSRMPMYGAVKASNPGGAPLIPPFGPGDVQYFAEYPEDIASYSLSFASRLPGIALMGELTHRPNQPVQLSTIDLLYAFTSNTLPTPLRADAQATPAGGHYSGYDRLKVTHLALGAAKPLPGLLGAAETSLAGELGAKFVHDLPDPSRRRYGRSDVFGQSAFAGVAGNGIANASDDGYVTDSSWGYRVKFAMTYRAVAAGLDLSPSLAFVHDVEGWSPDGVFSAGRKIAVLALRAEYRKDWYGELAFHAIAAGRSFNAGDRGYASLVVGMKF
jgi:hypothetical protein